MINDVLVSMKQLRLLLSNFSKMAFKISAQKLNMIGVLIIYLFMSTTVAGPISTTVAGPIRLNKVFCL